MYRLTIITTCIFCMAMTLFEAHAQGSPRSAWMRSITGTVKVRRANSVNWIDAKPNMPVREKDAVRTFVESEAVVETAEGSRIVMGENSTFELSLFQGSGQTELTRINILNGSILSDVKKLIRTDSRFEFETPTATAAIRGTRVGFDVGSDTTSIRVYEGRVLVTPRGAQTGTELKDNEMTTVVRDQRTVMIRKMEEARTPAVPADTSTSRDSLPGADTLPAPDRGLDTTSLRDEPAPKAALALTVSSPAAGAVVDRPLITVSGTVTPGAEVTAGGQRVTVAAGGTFRLDVPIPDEEGSVELMIEAVLGERRATERRSVRYQPSGREITIFVTRPADRQVVCDRMVTVQGSVRPATVEDLSVNGKRLTVRNGTFSGLVELNDEPGDQPIEFEAVTGSGSRTVRQVVKYAPARSCQCNTQPPQISPQNIPPVSTQSRLVFAVLDKTPHDEITFTSEINGVKDVETGPVGSQFAVNLEPGRHHYRIYAEDLCRNRSAVLQGSCTWLARPLTIRLRKPAGSTQVLYIPPAGRPDDPGYRPECRVEFTVENLPGDDHSLLKEVSVINNRGGSPAAHTMFTDIDFDFDVAVKKGVNELTIRVLDDLDRVVTRTVRVEVR